MKQHLGVGTLLAIATLLASSASFAQQRPGSEIYAGTCIICHGTGKHAAPQFGDVEAWRPRAAQGLDILIPNAISGLRRMPPMGANPALSDLELARAAIYMLNAAGSRFDEPEEGDLLRWREIAEQRRQRP